MEIEPRGGAAAGSRPVQRGYRKLLPIAAIAALLLCGLLTLGYWPRAVRARQLAFTSETRRQTLPSVTVAPVKEAPAEIEIDLPGSVQAVTETPIFARADGYIKRRLADIGDRVTGGQLLAEIDSPELEQQIREAQAAAKRARSALRQAEAALAQSRANLGLAEVTATRWQTLVNKGVLSKQDGDEKRSAFEARQADVAAAEASLEAARENVAANEAAVSRLIEIQAFRQVRAPFAGVVTARNVDLGSLVSAGSSASVRELFRLAQVHTLRVFVSVPQSEATLIRPGLPCSMEVEEYRGREFPGKVTRTANSLDPSSRTLLTEVQVANQDGAVLPGMYATVRFSVRRTQAPALIPSSALRITAKGPVVAVLREGAAVHLQPVKLGRDYGTEIEVLEGLRAGQRVITSPTDEIREGAKVKPVAPAKPVPPAGGGMAR
jgi:RND family efflux transporter MFP subunit